MNESAFETAPRRRQRRWYQYSLATLLVAVALAAVLLSTYHTYVKLTEPASSVFFRNWQTIHNGEKIDRVQAVLGLARAPEDTSRIVDFIRSHPDRYPDGLEKGDRFLLYEIPHGRTCTMTVYVQFRNDHLVNHVPPGIQVANFTYQ
jgi:hypothetical protein